MKYDITLIQIVNDNIGTCKYLSMDMLRNCVDTLRHYHYVKENNFSSKYLWKHVLRTAKLLFAPERYYR